MFKPNTFHTSILLPVFLLASACAASLPHRTSQTGFFLGVAHGKAEPESASGIDSAQEEKDIADEENELKESDAAAQKAPEDHKAAVANETKKNESAANETKKNETKQNESAANETKKNESQAKDGNETRVLNETEAKEAKAAWDEWYETRSAAMWAKCSKMPVCVKLCRWIRLAFVLEYGDEEKAFKTADKDGDGKVSSSEFVDAAVKAGVTDEAMSVKGYAILYVIDINEDGFVSEKNYQKLVDLAKEGDRKDDEAEERKEQKKEAADEGKKGDAEKVKKTAEEEKEARRAEHAAEIAELMKEVDAHEEELGEEVKDEYKELMKDHPKPTHHPPPHGYTRSEPDKVSSDHKVAKLESPAPPELESPEPPKHESPEAAVEPEHPKSSCRRSATAAASVALALRIVAVM